MKAPMIQVGTTAEGGTEFTENFVIVLKTLKEIGLAQKHVVPLMKVYTDKWTVNNTVITNCSLSSDTSEGTL